MCLETRSLTAYSSGDFKYVICYPTLCTFTIDWLLVAMCNTVFSFMLSRTHNVSGLHYSTLMFGICFEAANAPVSEFTLLGCFFFVSPLRHYLKRKIYTHLCLSSYISIYIYMYVCMCKTTSKWVSPILRTQNTLPLLYKKPCSCLF